MQADADSRADAGWLAGMTARADSKARPEMKISVLISANASSGRLDVVAQRFLLGLVFMDAALDELADRHHFHDASYGVGLAAAHDLARHDRADRLLENPGAALAQHPDNVAL